MPETSAECEFVGEGDATIAGIGILVGFVGQALLSLGIAVWAFVLSKQGRLDVRNIPGSIPYKIEHKRLKFVKEMLMIGFDIQMALGVAYMVTIFAELDTIDLYHLRLAFDITSFVGVSIAAALVCWTYCETKTHSEDPHQYIPQKLQHHKIVRSIAQRYLTARHCWTYVFAAMFLALTIILCQRLDEWAPDKEPGRCYHSSLVSLSSDSHPKVDIIYVAITASYMLAVMGCAAGFSTSRRKLVLLSASLQFPVHLYMTIALRVENHDKLSGPEKDENEWDFGQTTAVVLLGAAVAELANKGKDYFLFERDLRNRGKTFHGSDMVVRRERSLEEEEMELQNQDSRDRGERLGVNA